MTVADITQLITSVGFPIVACGALFWRMNMSEKQHNEEMDKITTALNNNTLALTQLSERITYERKE